MKISVDNPNNILDAKKDHLKVLKKHITNLKKILTHNLHRD